jgi:photosystem II stability/assembly factor-like uncharacterized protein
MRPFLTALAVAAALAPAVCAGELRNFPDAALHAVQFVDRDEGWAVGDEGVIWHTIDGGQSWERQPSRVRASLRAVHFLNSHTGWVAGREELPRGGSAGVLLYTNNGVDWRRVLPNTLPGLNHVCFVNAREGFVVGDGSEAFPSGIFKTSDGGRSWKAVKGPRSPSWMAAAFQDGGTGALVGAWSRLAKMRHDRLSTADVEELRGRTMSGLQLSGNRGVAVGQGGAVLVSRTSGARWGYADLQRSAKLSRDVLANLDFHAVHLAGNHAWVVGRPGSVVLHSPDLGDHWEVLPTRHPLPLNGVFFLDGRRGWAVGEVGCILATRDGGRTWSVQRRGGVRAAVLFVHAHPAGVPVDTVALLGGEEGYLTAALRVVASDPNSAAFRHAPEAQRLAAAVRQAGGTAGEMLWQFPAPQHLLRSGKEEVLKDWNQLHGNRADRELLRQLVLALRMWRPSVVVTDHPDARVSGSGASALVAEALHEAFVQAADPKAFPEQIRRLGLQPWRVAKVYARWQGRKDSQVILDLDEACPRLEATARDFAGPALALLARRPDPLPAERFYHLLDARKADAAGQRRLMDGIALARGGEARRDLPPAAALRPAVKKALRSRRAFMRLTETPPGALSDPSRTLAQLKSALAGLSENQGAAAVFAVATGYARQGQWALAREAFILLADRYPTHPRAADAYRWLICHNGSSEARRRHELGQFLVITQAAFTQPPSKPALHPANPNGARLDKQLLLLASQSETRQWFRGSLEVGKRLAALGPLEATDPAVQFCLQAAHRQLGEWETARKWYQSFKERQSPGPWRDAAAAELWLNDRVGPPPKPLASCRQAAARPFLDGRFNDPCWKGRKPLLLRNAVGNTAKDYRTEAWLAYDAEFLYLAVHCRHPAGRHVPAVKVRRHDEDLRGFDRVSLLLDLDRDYSTYFRFEVDQRGCLFEDCWGDRSWDPRWYVALKSDATSWHVEAAIPLSELLGDRVRLGTAWAFNLVRILPGRGVQAFSVPADVDPRPEGMGLLVFTQDPREKAIKSAPPQSMPGVP